MSITKESRKQTRDKLSFKSVDLKLYALPAAAGALCSALIAHAWSPQELAGGFVLSTILLAVLYRDILRYKPQFLSRYRMMVLLGAMVAGTLWLGRLGDFTLEALSRGFGIATGHPAMFGMPIPAGAMLVTLLFDFHTSIMFSFIVSLLTGIWLGDPVVSVYVFVGSLTASFSIIRCKKRTAIIRGGFWLLVANLAMTAGLLLYSGDITGAESLPSFAYAAAGAIIAMAMVSILLPLLEYAFKVTTDISLLELLDLDQPLMKNLMISAPGTYHHSIIVGNLVESVAEDIGVNPLLARVGAYYHDIGKMRMPEYFIENSPTGVSRHDRLSPHMSGMILISHVKEGVELAIEHKLPEVIKDVIEQHHGTALITYFFEKAKGINDGSASGPNEEEYRYPGPRPQSRTAALIMIADAVEAASRVLNEPTPARIEALVDKIVNHIFLAGQLDECELTLKDIYQIKARFTHVLTGMLHKRINYPGFDFNGEDGGGGNGDGKGPQQPKEEKAFA